MIDESFRSAKSSQYFKCQSYSHIATQCPSRNLLIKDCNEDWRRSTVFYTYIAHEGKHYKLMIDVVSCVNIIAKTALEKMSLKAEPHRHLHNVNWVDKIAQFITSVVRSLSIYLVTRIMFGVTS